MAEDFIVVATDGLSHHEGSETPREYRRSFFLCDSVPPTVDPDLFLQRLHNLSRRIGARSTR